MEFILSGEIYAESGIAQLNHKYAKSFSTYFQAKNYSIALKRIFIIFICRPGGPFNQRKRLDPKKGVFMIDILMDFPFVMSAGTQEKEEYYFESFRQIYPLLEKYKSKIAGLKIDEFKNDLEALLNQLDNRLTIF